MSEQDAVELLEEYEGDAYELDRKLATGEIPKHDNMYAKMIVSLYFALEACQQEVERLEQAVGWCQWGPTEDGGYNYFETSCGRSYFVVEGTLAENEYQHCPGCGGAIEEGDQDEQ